MTLRRVILRLTAILLTFLIGLRATADIEMTVEFFDGFDDAIQGGKRKQALTHALSIWSAALTGTIPVNVHAKFADLGAPGPAATAGATLWDFTTNGLPDTFYPAALLSQLDGQSRTPSTGEFAGFHIKMEFNVNTDFYYGLDQSGPLNMTDFLTVVLHELGHGLGFQSRVTASGSLFSSAFDLRPKAACRSLRTASLL